MAKSVYDLIKKQNGERFARAIRNYDNGIFDIPGIVDFLKYAGNDAEPILEFLENKKLELLNIQKIDTNETPFELLHRAGYRAEYADTLEKQNAIAPLFAPGEQLCTFQDVHRFENYYIINAVRYDIDKIQRADFIHPARQDAYGTSVISIQIAKRGGFISIKNRYNHMVEHPDNTFDSNPDNIIEGLSSALMKYFNVDFETPSGVPDWFIIAQNHLFRFHTEANGTYFGADAYVQNGAIHKINKDYQLIIGSNILDTQNSRMTDIAETDSFADVINGEIQGRKIAITRNGANHRISANGISIMDVCGGELISLHLPNTERIPDEFLRVCKSLRRVTMPRVKGIGEYCFNNCPAIAEFEAPLVEMIDNDFMTHNRDLTKLSLPAVREIGKGALFFNEILNEISMPNLEEIGTCALCRNTQLKEIDLPHVRKIGFRFLYDNKILSQISMPMAESIGDDFLYANRGLREISLPMLQKMGSDFIGLNKNLKTIFIPKITTVDPMFITHHPGIQIFKGAHTSLAQAMITRGR